MSNLKRTVIKICSCLIPIKSQRKKFRNKFLIGKYAKKMKDNNYHKVIKIFGIKIKFINKKAMRQLIQNLNNIINEKNEIIKHIQSLQNVRELYHTGDHVKAEQILREYLDKSCFNIAAGTMMNSIKLSELKTVKKALKLNHFFQTSESDILSLKDYFCKAKSIAIVGNSGRELGKGRGKEIDAHDIVIRFNNFPSGFEKDYGGKTNIWFRNTSNDIKEDRDIRSFDYVIFDPFIYNIRNELFNKFIEWCNEYPQKIKHMTLDFRNNEVIEKTNVSYPTSGFMIIYLLGAYWKLENIDCYGFSFLDQKYDTSHYYDNLSQLSKDHNMENECQYLRKLYKKLKEK